MMNQKQITEALLDSFKETRKAQNALEKAKAKASGPYNRAVEIATNAESRAAFAEGFEAFERIVKTDGRVAGMVNAKPRKKPTKSGERFTVPGSIMNAKSTVLGAFDFGVSFYDDDGATLSYSAIRKAVAAAKAEAAKADLSDDDKLRLEAADIAQAIVKGLDHWGGKGLADVVAALDSIRDNVEAANAEGAAADDAIAKAA